MPRFLTTNRALAEIERVIDEASGRLVLLSPYQRMGDDYRSRILAAADRGVSVILVYGDQDRDVAAILDMGKHHNVTVVHVPKLHAKCYYNESAMVITSLNLLKTSEKNWEMGVGLEAKEQVYLDAVREAELIISAGRKPLVKPPSNDRRPTSSGSHRAGPGGFCIRCRAGVPLNSAAPLCRSCYESWARYENADYEESWCHECGDEGATSYARPRCWGCYAAAPAI